MKNNKAITITSLIITIIVLLILAFVTINMVNDGGILAHAKNAQAKYNSAEEKYQIRKNEYLNLLNNNTNGSGNSGEDGNPDIDAKPDEPQIILKKAADITPEDYGKIVQGYNAKTSNGKNYNDAVKNWKIFYADNNNIYLISDYYITYKYCPNGKNGTSITKYTNYKLPMDNVINDYTGSAEIRMKLKSLNNQYFFKTNGTANFSSTNKNMKAVAYMMDTTVWDVYKDDAKADYAIGSPTLEMFMKSYSQKNNVDYRTQAYNAVGYKISVDGGTSWANFVTGKIKDNLYTTNTNADAGALAIASPSVTGNDNIMMIYYTGDIRGGPYNNRNIGFRPLVCLNSEVQLKTTDDETGYIIV